jgi:hypothetical protein
VDLNGKPLSIRFYMGMMALLVCLRYTGVLAATHLVSSTV